MMNPRIWVAIAVAGCCACLGQPASAQECEASDTWFASTGVPKPDDAHRSRFNSNCAFHQFSWQAFLWLTDALQNGTPRFQSMFSDASIDSKAKNPTEHVLDGVQQADSLGILVDQNGRAVYTNMLINDVYRQFVLDRRLNTREGMKEAAANLVFPTGAISLKAAWKIVGPNEDVSRFYTTTAKIALLSKTGNTVDIDPQRKLETVKVALVGFHIAWVVDGHPEAIWATFEQVDNAPDFKENQQMSQPVANKSYTFYRAGTPAQDCNVNNASVIELDKSTQKLTPVTQTCRQYRTGGGEEPNVKNIDSLNKSVRDHLATKQSVWRNYEEVGAVWMGEDQASAKPFHPDWSPQIDNSQIKGSDQLSNSVIETFTQNKVSKNQCFSCHNTMAVTDTRDLPLVLPGKDINTSHILLRKYMNNPVIKR